MTKISLCAFADEASNSFSGQIDALKRNNIGYLEMRNADQKNVTELTAAEAKEYANILESNGLAVRSLGSPIGKSDISASFSAVLDLVKRTCELACILGASRIRIFSFHNAINERAEVIERLGRMVEVAKSFGVVLCHENEKNIYGDIAARVLDLLENVPGIRSVYDPANFIQVGEPAEKTLALFSRRADYFHIKDVIANTGELVPAGHGDGKIKELIDTIVEDKVLTLEPHLAVFDGYAKIDDTAMKHRFNFKDNDEAFDAAAKALKSILTDAGYKETNGGFIR